MEDEYPPCMITRTVSFSPVSNCSGSYKHYEIMEGEVKNYILLGLSDIQKAIIDPENKLFPYEINSSTGIFVENIEQVEEIISKLGMQGKYELLDSFVEGLIIYNFLECEASAGPFVANPENANETTGFTVDISSADNCHEYIHTPLRKYCQKFLIPVVKKNIIIKVPHNRISAFESSRNTKDNFYIKIWSSPVHDLGAFIDTPASIFGHRVDCRDSAFMPSYEGKIIVDNNFVVAELFSNELYIHYDSVHSGSNEEKKIMEEIIKIASRYVNMTMEEIALEQFNNMKATSGKLSGKLKNEFTKHGEKFLIHQIKNTKTKIRETINESETLKNKYILAIRQIEDERKIVKTMEINRKSARQKLSLQFDKIHEISNILNISFQDDVLYIYTKELFCQDPVSKKIHEIGKFKICINFADYSIRWFNMSRRIEGYNGLMQAPFVGVNGISIILEQEDIFTQLFADYDFQTLVELSIQYIENPPLLNKMEEMKYICKWPEIERKAS